MLTQTYTPVEGYELITLAEAKAHLRLDEYYPDEDALLTQYIVAAVQTAENYIERTISSEVLVLGSNVYQGWFSIKDWRDVKVTSINATLSDAIEYSIPPENYTFRKFWDEAGYGVFFNAPFVVADVTDSLKITLLCEPPLVIKQACLLFLSDYYERREDRGDSTNSVAHRLLRPYRKY